MEIFALGKMRLTGSGELKQHQPLLLLIYLAMEGPKSRDHLAMLLWPHANRPLNNLSSALTRIRNLEPSLITTTGDRVATAVDCDATRLLDLLTESHIEPALTLYTGPFLDDLSLRFTGEELDEWIHRTREFLAGQMRDAVIRLAVAKDDLGEHRQAATLAERAVVIGRDAIPDPDHLPTLHQLLIVDARPMADEIRREAEDFGFALESRPVPPLHSPTLASHLPRARSPLVGRQNELNTLSTMMRDARIVTVTGTGGSGKTRLARELAVHTVGAGTFRGGVHWVNLAVVQDAEDVAEAILGAIEGRSENSSFEEAVAAAIGPDSTLIILDNFEHVVGAAPLVQTIVDELSNLTILVTSRHRLGLDSEVALDLAGLATNAPKGSHALPPAVELFVDRGVRADRDFRLTDSARPQAVAICELVAGLPLAIELVASWLRVLPIEAIVEELNKNLALLSPSDATQDPMRQVFDQSWDLLTPEERQAMLNLTVFRGGFNRKAAAEVAACSIPTLAALVDKSLLNTSADGRFWRNILTYRSIAERFAQDPKHAETLYRSHARYMANWTAEQHGLLLGSEHRAAIEAFDLDLDNTVAAWRWAVNAEDWEVIEQMMDGVDSYLLRTGHLELATSLYEEALAACAADSRVLAALANNLAWMQMLRGDPERALLNVDIGVRSVAEDDWQTTVALLRTQAAVEINRGNWPTAGDVYRAASDLVDPDVDPKLAALLREDLAHTYRESGALSQASEAYRQVLDTARRQDDPHMSARSYLNLGNIELLAGRPERALVLLEEGMVIATEHGLTRLRDYFYAKSGKAHLLRGDINEAVVAFSQGAELTDKSGEQWVHAENLVGLATAAALAGDDRGSIDRFRQAMRIGADIQQWPIVLEAMSQACIYTKPGKESPESPELLRLVASHPSTAVGDRAKALEALGLEDRPEPEYDPAGLRIDEAAERTLAMLRFG